MVKHIHSAYGVNYLFHAIHVGVNSLNVGLQSLNRRL